MGFNVFSLFDLRHKILYSRDSYTRAQEINSNDDDDDDDENEKTQIIQYYSKLTGGDWF